MRARLGFRNLPLFGKLLVPFLALTVFLGVFGVFLVVRDLSARAQTALEQDLARRTLDARSLIRDRELYLLESVNFAANLQGVTPGIAARDADAVGRLLQSVLALKTDLDLLVATDTRGIGLIEFSRNGPGDRPERHNGARWAREGFVQTALHSQAGDKSAGFLTARGERMLVIAAPVCAATKACDAVGVAIAGMRVADLADIASGSTTEHPGVAAGVVLYDADGRTIGAAGLGAPATRPPALPQGRQIRRTGMIGDEQVSTLYSPLEIGGRPAGALAVSVPTAPAFASVRGAQFRLALVLLAAMVCAIALGAMMSRLILRQVRPLVDTNRALGGGDLSARAPVLGDDELGELARGVNQMAEQLEASYDTLEMRVAERTDEVRRLMQERTEFFASISHELRTPLAIIKGQGKMLLDPKKRANTRKTDDAAKTIVDTANQLVDLVNQILDLARAERGSLDVSIEEVKLGEALKELRPTIEGLAKAGGSKVVWEVGRDVPLVLADRARLREIVVNLVDNAVKYTPSGGRITVSAAEVDGIVEISISDTGIGIPAEAGERVFEPFYRAKGASAQGGQASSGLGLGLAKRLVEAQGGTISYISRPGEGTTFTFTLIPVASERLVQS